MKFERAQTPNAPAFADAINAAVRAVCRFYGVPSQLCAIHEAGDRQDAEQLDAHLVRDAVLPMLTMVESALTKFFATEVRYDRSRLALPSSSGLAQMAMTMAQAGVYTTNEIRAMVGLEAISGGDTIPAPAGAPDRNGESTGG